MQQDSAQQNDSLQESLRLFRVDREPNVFSLLNVTKLEEKYKVTAPFQDDTEHADEDVSLFFPGCMFQATAPELVEIVYDWLRARKLVNTFSPKCCGNILRFSASQKKEVFQDYEEQLFERLQERMPKRIITSCPNCLYTYRALVEAHGVEVIPLSRVLLEQGLTIKAKIAEGTLDPETTYCIHDSCPDRKWGLFAESVRELFDETSLREMKHNQKTSQCCGFGKMLNVINPTVSEKINATRVNEFFATDADMLITYCFTCISSFSPIARMGKGAHYLELLFDYRIDWDAVSDRMFNAQETCKRGIKA